MEDGKKHHGKSNKAAITKRHVNGTNDKKDPHKDVHGKKHPKPSFLHRNAFVITMMLNTMTDGIMFSVSGQYRYRFFHDQHQDELDRFNVTGRSRMCESESDDVKAIQDAITKDTTRWSQYENYVAILPMFISSLTIGLKSDQIGRRFLFLLSVASCTLTSVILSIVIKLKAHVGWMILGGFVFASSGGGITMFFGSSALVSDTHSKHEVETTDITVDPDNPSVQEKGNEQTTPEKNKDKDVDDEDEEMDAGREQERTYKLIALDVGRKIASSIVAFVTGYIIEYAGFFYTMVLTVAIKSVLFLFAYIFIIETGRQKKSTDFRAPLRTIAKALKDPVKRATIILCCCSLFFMILGVVEEFEIMRIYQMSPPFCFNAIQLGYLSSVNRIKGLFAMPLMWLWKRLHVSEPSIAAIGLLGNMASALSLATIRQSWVFYFAPVLAIPGTLSSAIVKAISSRLIGRSALASTFALMIAGEEVFWFIGSTLSNFLYGRYVSTVPTVSFYLGASAFAVSFTMLTLMSVREHQLEKRASATDTKDNTNL